MAPTKELPLPKEYSGVNEYVDDLVSFVTSTKLLNLLCGGVHILDFFVSTPDLFEQIFDRDWIEWFDLYDFEDLLDFLLKEDVGLLKDERITSWRGRPRPPETLIDYVSSVQKLCLNRVFSSSSEHESIIPRIAIGMKEKKLHEVGRFAFYVNDVVKEVETTRDRRITNLVDFGAGQSYLPRALASPPYNKNVVALEGKAENVKGAKALDVMAKLTPKEKQSKYHKQQAQKQTTLLPTTVEDAEEDKITHHSSPALAAEQTSDELTSNVIDFKKDPSSAENYSGSIQHIQQQLEDGDLTSVVSSLNIQASSKGNHAEGDVSSNEYAVDNGLHPQSSGRNVASGALRNVIALMWKSFPPCHEITGLESWRLGYCDCWLLLQSVDGETY